MIIIIESSNIFYSFFVFFFIKVLFNHMQFIYFCFFLVKFYLFLCNVSYYCIIYFSLFLIKVLFILIQICLKEVRIILFKLTQDLKVINVTFYVLHFSAHPSFFCAILLWVIVKNKKEISKDSGIKISWNLLETKFFWTINISVNKYQMRMYLDNNFKLYLYIAISE